MIFKIAKIGLFAIILNSILFVGCSVDNSTDTELRNRYEYSINSIRRTMGGFEPSLRMAMTSMLYMHMNRKLSLNNLRFSGVSTALFDPDIGLIVYGISPEKNYSKIIIYKLDEAFNIVEGFEKAANINEKVMEHPDQLIRPDLVHFRLFFLINDFPEIIDFIEANGNNFSVGLVFEDERVTNQRTLTMRKSYN